LNAWKKSSAGTPEGEWDSQVVPQPGGYSPVGIVLMVGKVASPVNALPCDWQIFPIPEMEACQSVGVLSQLIDLSPARRISQPAVE
jgi:hypothetical protein